MAPAQVYFARTGEKIGTQFFPVASMINQGAKFMPMVRSNQVNYVTVLEVRRPAQVFRVRGPRRDTASLPFAASRGSRTATCPCLNPPEVMT